MEEPDTNDIRASLHEHGYELGECIGHGAFASVYKIYHPKYQRTFALKVIHVDGNMFNPQVKSYMNEISLLTKAACPTIISIYKHFRDRKFMYQILEYCPNGSLKDLIDTNEEVRLPQFIKIFNEILSALAYLHKKLISHGDIKPENILFDEYYRAKLGDFGLSNYQINSKFLRRTYLCSPAFAAPELLQKKPYDPFKADIWSLGITMYNLVTKKLPYPCSTIEEFVEMLDQRYDIWKNTNVNNSIKDVINSMLIVTPSERPTAEALLSSSFLKTETIQLKAVPSDVRFTPTKVKIPLSQCNSMLTLSVNKYFPKGSHNKIRVKTGSIQFNQITTNCHRSETFVDDTLLSTT